jgi:spore maturation protein SpmB
LDRWVFMTGGRNGIQISSTHFPYRRIGVPHRFDR